MRSQDLVGKTFGRWTVQESAGSTKSGKGTWLCKCECGTLSIVYGNNLIQQLSRSCGCSRKGINRRHGQTKGYLHNTWITIRRRCRDTKHPSFKNYGGRGIKVCDEWQNSYEAFRDYMLSECGERPEGYSIDRIDNDGDYEPGNVKWSSRSEQARNQRRGPRKHHNVEKVGPRVLEGEIVAFRAS